MPDISKCADSECPSKQTCYRFIAPPSQYQAYSEFGRLVNAPRCDDYIEAVSKSQMARLNTMTGENHV